MGFRFRRTVRVLPGVRLNFSKSGVSTSLGVRGAHVTIGHGQIRQTVGIPGTGLSYSTSSRYSSWQPMPGQPMPGQPTDLGPLLGRLAGTFIAYSIFAIVGVLLLLIGLAGFMKATTPPPVPYVSPPPPPKQGVCIAGCPVPPPPPQGVCIAGCDPVTSPPRSSKGSK
jgi:hypothetical protein